MHPSYPIFSPSVTYDLSFVNQNSPLPQELARLCAICQQEPAQKITHEKKLQWQAIESSLSTEQKNALTAVLGSFSGEYIPAYALITDSQMLQELAILFALACSMDSRFGEDWLNAIVACMHEPLEIPLLEYLLREPLNEGDDDWLDDESCDEGNSWQPSIYAKFTTLPHLTAAYIFRSSPHFQQNAFANADVEFTAAVLEAVFRLVDSKKEQYKILRRAMESLDRGVLQDFLTHILNSSSSLVMYLHGSLNSQAYVELWWGEHRQQFLQTWCENDYVKGVALWRLQKEEALNGLIEEITFQAPDHEEWSLSVFRELQAQGAEGELIEVQIQAIPPLCIAWGMHSLDYQAWLPEYLPYFTEKQIEACCMYLSEDGIEERLEGYYEKLDTVRLAQALDAIGESGRLFACKKIDELSLQAAAIISQKWAWMRQYQSLIERLEGTPRPGIEEIEQAVKEGSRLLQNIRAFCGSKMRHYAHTHSTALGDLFSQLPHESVTLSQANAKLKKWLPEEEEEEEEKSPLSASHLAMFTATTLELLGITSEDGFRHMHIHSDEDLHKLGLSPIKQSALYQIQEKLELFGRACLKIDENGQCAQEIGIVHLLSAECISDAEKGAAWENLYCENLLVELNAENVQTLQWILSHIGGHFPEEQAESESLGQALAQEASSKAVKAAVRFCAHFIRTRHLAYVLYQHKAQLNRTASVEA